MAKESLPPGLDQMDFIEPFPSSGGASASALTANTAYMARFRAKKAITISQAYVHAATSSGNVDVGFYSSSDGGATLTRLASSGSTACPATNTTSAIALSASINLLPGVDYWWVFAADNVTATFLRQALNFTGGAAHGLIKKRVMSLASQFPLPASMSPIAGNTNIIWFLGA